MVLGLNKDVLKRIVETLGLQSAVDKLPTDVIPTIQPVLIANPERIVDIVRNGFSTATIYTTPTDKDFYLTSWSINSCSQDQDGIVSDVITVVLEDGRSMNVASVKIGSGADETNSVFSGLDLKVPIKLKRGSIITSTEGSSEAGFVIIGYTV